MLRREWGRAWVGAAAALAVALAGPATANAAEVIVEFEPNVSARERAQVRGVEQATVRGALPSRPRFQLLEVSGSAQEAVRELERRPEIAHAEPNLPYRLTRVPDDPQFGVQWALRNIGQQLPGLADPSPGVPGVDIGAVEAWDITTGDGVVLGIADTGIQFDNPDLAPNVWTNPGETGEGRESNGIDDDHNGFVDDWRGWDTYNNDNDPSDDNGHGTLVAGAAAARGDDGIGVAGVAWGPQILVTKGAGADGVPDDLFAAIASVDYAFANGADIVNASGAVFMPGPSEMIENIIAGWDGLLVAAAGNEATDLDQMTGRVYPCQSVQPNVVCVGAIDRFGKRASFSNHGRQSVDVAAPGAAIRTTMLGGGYGYTNGTSLASPIAAGIAVLLKSHDPALTPAQLRQALIDGSVPDEALADMTVSGGRVSAIDALKLVGPPICRDATAKADPGEAVEIELSCDGRIDTIAVEDAPGHGSLGDVDQQHRTVTYTPEPGFAGTDAFTYVAEGPLGRSEAATVTITVDEPDEPKPDEPANPQPPASPAPALPVAAPAANGSSVTPPPDPPSTPSTPGTPARPAPAARVSVLSQVVRVSRAGVASVTVRCRSTTRRCRGTATLTAGGSRSAGARSTFARRAFSVAAGRRATIRLRLTASARRRLARSGRLRARLTLRLATPAAGRRTVSRTVRLVAAGRPRTPRPPALVGSPGTAARR